MIVTFPNLGNMSVLLSVLMREWKIPFIIPPKTTRNTLSLGSKYAHRDACLPMKIVLGNFVEGHLAGADTAVFLGGKGPCLFGCFSEMIRLALEENSIPLAVLRIETNMDGATDALNLIKKISCKSTFEILSPLPEGMRSCTLLDLLENHLLLIRATIEDKQRRKAFSSFEDGVFELLRNAHSFIELNALLRASFDEATRFRGHRESILSVGIVGDIYTTIDAEVNARLQRRLADMGVYSERSMTIEKWFRGKISLSPFSWKWYSKPYIEKSIGGFARQTVGYAAMWSRSLDGIIQIHPLNCMPEVVAKSILDSIMRDPCVPFLSLVLDELLGDLGYITRLEAFCDLLEEKRRNDKLLARN